MDKHRLITVAYELYADNKEGVHEQLEKAPKEYPFQFVTELGMSNPAFEAHVKNLQTGDHFDFTLSVEESNGEYYAERVIPFPKDMFCVDGHFMKDEIYEGNIIPMVNADGNRFMGTVVRVEEKTVTIDLNAPYAGRAFHYVGDIIEARDAKDEEVKGALNIISGEGCGCGCGDCEGGCGEDCYCGEGECGHHHHEDGEHHCCGHHHHHHEDGEHHCCHKHE